MFDRTRMAIAGWACLGSGAALATAGLAEYAGAPTTPKAALGIAMVCAAGFASGAYALAALLPLRPKRIGMALVYAGLATWVIGGLLHSAEPEILAVTLGGALQSAGLLTLGVATLRAGARRGWLRYVPLLSGAWFLAALLFQLALSAGAQPPPLLLLGAWGVWWALLGALVLARARSALEE